MIEGSWSCPVLVLPNLKRLEEDKLFYDEEVVRVSSPKIVETFFPGICYQLNLPNGFQYSARNQLTTGLKISQLTVRKSC